MPRNAPAYEDDFVAWLEDQAQHARRQEIESLDLENIAEELEGMARSDRREIRNRLIVLLVHLLKHKFSRAGAHAGGARQSQSNGNGSRPSSTTARVCSLSPRALSIDAMPMRDRKPRWKPVFQQAISQKRAPSPSSKRSTPTGCPKPSRQNHMTIAPGG
jgi:hypothetical protein